MSATPGKVLIDGITRIQGRDLFVLKFLQARRRRWLDEVFFAEYDPVATWLDDLRPAFGASEFAFEAELRELGKGGPSPAARRGGRVRGEPSGVKRDDDAPRPHGWAATG